MLERIILSEKKYCRNMKPPMNRITTSWLTPMDSKTARKAR